MEKQINRVIQAWQGWEPLKQQYEQALGAEHRAHEKDLAKLQLDYLHKCQHRLKDTATYGEQACLRLLDSIVRKLEKQVYPNRFQRTLLQIRNVVYDRPKYLLEQARQRDLNMDNLRHQLTMAGLAGFAGRVEHHLHSEDHNVRISVDSEIGAGKRMNIDLHFKKDDNGNFQLPMMFATLLKNGEVQREHLFETKDWPGLKTSHIFNLLEGRAINQHYTNATGHTAERWLEIGTNGLNAYHAAYGYDLRKKLEELPITGNKAEILASLAEGNKVLSGFPAGSGRETIYLTANPSGRDILLYDSKHKETTTEKLEKKPVIVKQMHQAPANEVRKGVRNGHRH